jgi:hypothetical protein
MSKKIIASVAIAAALFAGSVAAPANAATKATVSAALKAEVAAAVSDATTAGDTAILVTGYAKATAASKALVAYATKYVAAQGASVTVLAAAGNAAEGLEVVAADNNTAARFAVNGVVVHDGDLDVLPAGTTSVNVTTSAVSNYATVSVDGATGLTDGLNILSFTVTAADGTQDVFNVFLQVGN